MTSAGPRALVRAGRSAGEGSAPADRAAGAGAGLVSLYLQRFWFWAAIVAMCGAAGAVYSLANPDGRPIIGLVYGICTGGAVMLFEQGLVLPRLRERLRRLPWLASVLSTEAAYLVLILFGGGVAGTALWVPGILGGSFAHAVVIGPVTILYALMVSAIIITMLRMRDLIGADVFRNVMLGRYHRPVEEERIFLFIDLIGSTAYAQARGDLAAQGFLGAIFAVLAGPVRDHGGSIDDYVGDMALVTWPMRAGVAKARCIACVFTFLDAIEADAAMWRRRFGQVPQFQVALHGGSVVTAEIGIDRHKISYFGDVVNTTGRIEALCRTLDAPILVSAELYGRLEGLPESVAARRLGAHALKGRGQLLDVLALERPGRRQAGAAA